MVADGETLSVLALDGADYRLAKRWDCENILLGNHAKLESYNYSTDKPSTPEVWTTVATGLGPEEHGVTISTSQSWEHPLLRFASKFTGVLPWRLRRQLGGIFRDRGHEQALDTTDAAHVFESGAVYTWPGITPAENLLDAWRQMERINHRGLSEREWRKHMVGNLGKELGWLRMQSKIGTPVAGVHSHLLDAAGHVYCEREEKLREYYRIVDDELGEVRRAVDHLLVLSDHGMTVSWLDEEPGGHSWEALVAYSGEDDPPTDVYDVAGWIRERLPSGPAAGDDLTVPEDQLRDLGYLG